MKEQQDDLMDYMKEAIHEAELGIHAGHGGPFGCVIVKGGKVIGRGHNSVLVNRDPTCHGEMMAIRDACENIGSYDLKDCVLFTTAAPCPMCRGAILWANIEKVYYGCTVEDTESLGFRDRMFYQNWTKYNSDNFGETKGRKECKELYEEYKNLTHLVY